MKELSGGIMELSNRSLQKIDNIKIAAKRLFDQHGFNLVTMDSVVKQSNVSKGTVYKYFSDKTVLYESIVKDIYEQEHEGYSRVLNNNLPFVDKVRQIIAIRVEKYKGTNERFFQDDYVQSKELEDYKKSYALSVSQLRKELYQIGRNEGYISDAIDDCVLELYFDIIQSGLSQRYNDISNMPKEELRRLLDMIYAGVIIEK